VNERERDVGAATAVERENHARGGSQEADAEPSGEGRQARGARIDGAVALLGRLLDRPRADPAETTDPAQPTEKA
jgi:hypothetical protein